MIALFYLFALRRLAFSIQRRFNHVPWDLLLNPDRAPIFGRLSASFDEFFCKSSQQLTLIIGKSMIVSPQFGSFVNQLTNEQ
jgi:hypothetical protein